MQIEQIKNLHQNAMSVLCYCFGREQGRSVLTSPFIDLSVYNCEFRLYAGLRMSLCLEYDIISVFSLSNFPQQTGPFEGRIPQRTLSVPSCLPCIYRLQQKSFAVYATFLLMLDAEAETFVWARVPWCMFWYTNSVLLGFFIRWIDADGPKVSAKKYLVVILWLFTTE